MTPAEYRRVIKQLGMSMAAAGRFLGVTARTSRRYAHGDAEVPVTVVLLLRALTVMSEFGVRLKVPDWQRGQH